MTEAYVQASEICWAAIGCNQAVPSDKYPVIPDPEREPEGLPIWVACLVFSLVLALTALTIKYFRSRASKKRIKSENKGRKAQIDNRVNDYDNELEEVQKQLEQAKQRQRELLRKNLQILGRMTLRRGTRPRKTLSPRSKLRMSSTGTSLRN